MATEIRWRRPGEMTQPEKYDLELLVEEVSNEFVPPLTARSSTTQAMLKDGSIGASNSYFDEMLTQDNLLLVEGCQLQGFLSFRAPHRDARLPEMGDCIYVSTIAVRPTARGRGFSRLLYEKLFDLPGSLPKWILLRTWSTNTHHLHLLAALGFILLFTVPDDRGLGIDTVYLGRQR